MKISNLFMAMTAIAILSGCATPVQLIYDAEVDRLCAIDGGVKVYETVPLPSSMFRKDGFINFFKPAKGEGALGPEYRYLEKDITLNGDGPDSGKAFVTKQYTSVHRISDQKLLGEATRYGRRGGDFPHPFHPSFYVCPDGRAEIELLRRLFVKENSNE